MFKAFLNIFRVPDLRKRVLFTLLMLAIYRVGFHVPLPGVNQERMRDYFQQQSAQGTAFGRLTQYFAVFTGGDLQQSTLFGLGIMPYISASIIFQLLTTVVPSLEKLQKEGESGRRKINEYTRYATVGLCLIQGTFWVRYMVASGLVHAEYQSTLLFWAIGILGLTTGTVFLMWLGEQIDEYGMGSGASLIIMGGIIARIPRAISTVCQDASFRVDAGPGAMGPTKIVFIIAAFVFVVAGSILLTQAQRRIPIQQAKHVRGRRVYGGQRQYLPLRVNHGGVMPIIFASSLMLFPGLIFSWLSRTMNWNIWAILDASMRPGDYVYSLCYVGLIYFFAYFWTTVQFQPKEMADNLRDYGSFVPGLRPGRRTADYLEKVMERITYVGAAFLAVIAVIPAVVARTLDIDFTISTFLGGTGLLIVVSVCLDLVQRIEASLVMRDYPGFLEESKGGRIRGART